MARSRGRARQSAENESSLSSPHKLYHFTYCIHNGSPGRSAAGNVDLSGNFNHADGYFAMRVPPNWSANMMSGDVFVLNTGNPDELILALLAELEPDEVGGPTQQAMKSAHELIDGMRIENFNLYPDTNRAEVILMTIGGLNGAKSKRNTKDKAAGTMGKTAAISRAVGVFIRTSRILAPAVPAFRWLMLVVVTPLSMQEACFGGLASETG